MAKKNFSRGGLDELEMEAQRKLAGGSFDRDDEGIIIVNNNIKVLTRHQNGKTTG
jgi:hypothetical protein